MMEAVPNAFLTMWCHIPEDWKLEFQHCYNVLYICTCICILRDWWLQNAVLKNLLRFFCMRDTKTQPCTILHLVLDSCSQLWSFGFYEECHDNTQCKWMYVCHTWLWTVAAVYYAVSRVSVHVGSQKSHGRDHLCVNMFLNQHSYCVIVNRGCKVCHDCFVYTTTSYQGPRWTLVLFSFKTCWQEIEVIVCLGQWNPNFNLFFKVFFFFVCPKN